MPRAYLSVDTQRAVLERAHNLCEYCQSPADYATETFFEKFNQFATHRVGDDVVFTEY